MPQMKTDLSPSGFERIFSWFSCICVKKEKLIEEKEHNHLHFPSIDPSGQKPISNESNGFVSQMMPERGNAVVFTLDELNNATLNFSLFRQIGQGGFGIVYKGTLSDGTEVAVKRTKKDEFMLRLTAQFQTEVNVLASVEHLNLVKFIGYCDEENERILVQEYVPNGNLRQHLDCEFGVVLDLLMRLDIAIDIAHALTYLHLYAERPIIHRDIKSSNILLTRHFRAKVADFGFSRAGSLGINDIHISKQIKGTPGYLDPEYLKSHQLTPKSDVYSYGILLLELLTGRCPIEPNRPLEEKITVRWAFKNFLENNLAGIMDPKLEKCEVAYVAVKKVSEVAFHCSAPTKLDRPNMNEVAECLWSVRKEYQAHANQQHGVL